MSDTKIRIANMSLGALIFDPRIRNGKIFAPYPMIVVELSHSDINNYFRPIYECNDEINMRLWTRHITDEERRRE